MEKKVLLLNSDYQPLKILPWQTAVMLYFKDKVTIVEEYEDFPLGTQKFTMPCPAVVVLRKYVKLSHKRVTFSRTNVFSRDYYTCQYCLTPDHKILTADLRWVEAGSLSVGDKLVGFDEFVEQGQKRRFKTSEIQSYVKEQAELYKVILDDGEEFAVTAGHRFLCRPSWGSYEWRTTTNLKGCYLPKHFNMWTEDDSKGAGWLAGMLDGEGWLSSRENNVAIAQNTGPVLDKLKQELSLRGFEFTETPVSGTRKCTRLYIKGGKSEIARLLGTIRPTRLLNKFEPEQLGTLRAKESHKVVSVEVMGVGEIVKMRTSTSTFIADGYLHHNCGDQPGASRLTYDHVMPRSRGGKTIWTNIVACCYPCNAKKADRTPEEAKMKLKKKPVAPTSFAQLARSFRTSNTPAEWDPYLPK